MNRTMHEIEPEEVMAYLDGELEASRASEVAAHIALAPNVRPWSPIFAAFPRSSCVGSRRKSLPQFRKRLARHLRPQPVDRVIRRLGE